MPQLYTVKIVEGTRFVLKDAILSNQGWAYQCITKTEKAECEAQRGKPKGTLRPIIYQITKSGISLKVVFRLRLY